MRRDALSLTLLGALALGSVAHASMVDTSVFGGYTSVAGGDLNADIDAVGNFAGAGANHINGGYYVGLDATFPVAPMLKVGPRIEMVDGSSASSYSGGEFDAEARVIPLELGVSTDLPLAAGLSLNGGLYAGYGLTSTHMDFSTGGGSFDANGDCFVGEAQAAAKYQIIPLLSVGLNLGYRYTTANTMVMSNASGLFAFGNGHNLPNFEHGGDAKADFSGANLGGAVTFSF